MICDLGTMRVVRPFPFQSSTPVKALTNQHLLSPFCICQSILKRIGSINNCQGYFGAAYTLVFVPNTPRISCLIISSSELDNHSQYKLRVRGVATQEATEIYTIGSICVLVSKTKGLFHKEQANCIFAFCAVAPFSHNCRFATIINANPMRAMSCIAAYPIYTIKNVTSTASQFCMSTIKSNSFIKLIIYSSEKPGNSTTRLKRYNDDIQTIQDDIGLAKLIIQCQSYFILPGIGLIGILASNR